MQDKRFDYVRIDDISSTADKLMEQLSPTKSQHVYLHIEVPEDVEFSIITHRINSKHKFGRIFVKEEASAQLTGWHTRFPLDPREDD